MMKLIVFGAVAFVLGLGGTTGVMVMTAKAPPVAADSTAAHALPAKAHAGEAAGTPPVEAAHAAGTAHASQAPADEPAPATPGAAATEAPADAHTASTTPVEAVVRPPVPAVTRIAHAATEPDAESYKQVGNILMNMKPAEAAKILAYLSDAQVEGLLRSMSPRNAASVLSQLPSERAAALSKRLLVPAPAEGR